MNKKQWLLILTSAAVCGTNGGCGARGNNSSARSTEMTAKITQQQAEAIAMSEVAKQRWKDSAIQNTRLERDVWMISLERIPAMPGGHAVVKLSDTGKVVGIIPGR